jgi:hypothetical protein
VTCANVSQKVRHGERCALRIELNEKAAEVRMNAHERHVLSQRVRAKPSAQHYAEEGESFHESYNGQSPSDLSKAL